MTITLSLKFQVPGVISTWSSEVKDILYTHNQSHIYDGKVLFPVKTIVAQIRSKIYDKQIEIVKTECNSKPKLRTFVTFKEYSYLPPHMGKPLSFIERKTISKLRLGILPLRIETARYLRPVVPENERLCYCKSGSIESEEHALFNCKMYENLRLNWLEQLNVPLNFNDLPTVDKLKLVLNSAENIRPTAKYVVSLMDLRRSLNKDY